jgi:hypothetical protein
MVYSVHRLPLTAYWRKRRIADEPRDVRKDPTRDQLSRRRRLGAAARVMRVNSWRGLAVVSRDRHYYAAQPELRIEAPDGRVEHLKPRAGTEHGDDDNDT